MILGVAIISYVESKKMACNHPSWLAGSIITHGSCPVRKALPPHLAQEAAGCLSDISRLEL